MPSHPYPTRPHSRPTFDIQIEMIELRADFARLGRRVSRLLLALDLPPNVEQIWNGDAAPTLETEIDGVLGVIAQEHLEEIERLLYRGIVATDERVRASWDPPSPRESLTCSHPDCPRTRSASAPVRPIVE